MLNQYPEVDLGAEFETHHLPARDEQLILAHDLQKVLSL